MDTLTQLAHPVLHAIFADFAWPDSLCWSIFLGLLGWPVSLVQAFQWISAGYIDTLHFTNEEHRSFLKLSTFTGTLLARRALFLSWNSTKIIHCYILKLFPAWIIIVLIAVAFYAYNPVSGRRIFTNGVKFLGLWLLYSLTNVTYVLIIGLGNVLERLSNIKDFFVSMSLHSRPEFTYTTAGEFDPRIEVRLLKVHRRLPLSRLSAEVVPCQLQHAPSYFAISYVWSHGPQDIQPILLNGSKLYVRRNVYDILDRCSSFFWPQYVWIDSICIDQTNDNEKTYQVRKMKEIYSRAETVLVCLGKGPGWLAFYLIRELNNVRSLYGEGSVPGYIDDFFQRRRTDPFLYARIRALESLLVHPWFERVWVVQEVVVSKKVMICFGTQSIWWQEFYDMLQGIISGRTVASLGGQSSKEFTPVAVSRYLGISSLTLLFAYRIQYHGLGPDKISRVLRLFGEREAKMPIDKVFALLGIAKSYDTDLTRFVDYDLKTEENVLFNLAVFLLDNGEITDVFDLAGIGRSRRNPNLPSWAVDWTVIRAGLPLNSNFAPKTMRYSAATQKNLKLAKGPSQREITLKGQLLDTICAILPIQDLSVSGAMTAPSMDSLPATVRSYLDDAIQLATLYSMDPYPFLPPQRLKDAVWRTLIGDKSRHARPAPAFYENSMRTVFEFMVKLEDASAPYSFDDVFRKGFKDKIASRLNHSKMQAFFQAHKEFQDIDCLFDSGKGQSPYQFCVTAKGFIGMVPSLTQIGDIVCLIHGLEVPYVLRSFGTRYKLVGDSYIHGIMDGEALVEGSDEDLILF